LQDALLAAKRTTKGVWPRYPFAIDPPNVS